MTVIPFALNERYSREQEKRISSFIQDCSEASIENEPSKPDNEDTIETVRKSSHNKRVKLDLKKLRQDILKYNKQIFEDNQSNLKDISSYQVSALNLYNYGFQDGIYGYVSVNRLNLNMPIYLGASEYNMSLGSAQIAQTSIPYGGKNTHAVLAGHCGFGYMDYFRHIDSLNIGDEIKITIPFGQITYSVCDKSIIKPSEFYSLKIQEGKDMLTLLTCYPYPTNKYRCCIICERKK